MMSPNKLGRVSKSIKACTSLSDLPHCNVGSCGLYYKHTMIVNYTSSIVNRLEALLTDNASHHLRSSCVYTLAILDQAGNVCQKQTV